jgi:hypothetical protein
MALQSVDVVILPDGRMDRKNASRYLGLAEKTLAMHASRGTGPNFVKRGRVWYYRDALDDWLKGDSLAQPGRNPPHGRAAPPNLKTSRRNRGTAR